MSLTEAQLLKVKKYLKTAPTNPIMDSLVTSLEDGADKEAELIASLDRLDTLWERMGTIADETSHVVAGGDARMSRERQLTMVRQDYEREQENLARMLGIRWSPGQTITDWRRR